MDATAIMFAARDLGIHLSVTKDNGISCKPASRLTPELREAIKANREALIRDVLMADALRYLAERYVEGTDLAALDALEDRLEDAYAAGELGAYREAIRAYVRAGLREIGRAQRDRGTRHEAFLCVAGSSVSRKLVKKGGVGMDERHYTDEGRAKFTDEERAETMPENLRPRFGWQEGDEVEFMDDLGNALTREQWERRLEEKQQGQHAARDPGPARRRPGRKGPLVGEARRADSRGLTGACGL